MKMDKEKKHVLPFDVARCIGIEGQDICMFCRRKEDGHPTRQLYIFPQAENGECADLMVRSSV
jgi:hypothetical protein